MAVDYSEIDALLEGDKPKQQRRGRPPKNAADVNAKQQKEAQVGWLSVFELLTIPFQSDASFDEREFEPMARATVRLVEVYPQLRFLLVFLAVVAVPAQGVRFFHRIVEHRRPTEQNNYGQTETNSHSQTRQEDIFAEAAGTIRT